MAACSSKTKKKLLLWVATLLLFLLTTAVTNGQGTTTTTTTAAAAAEDEIYDLTTEVQIGNNATLVFQGDKEEDEEEDEEEVADGEELEVEEVGVNDTTTPLADGNHTNHNSTNQTETLEEDPTNVHFGNTTIELNEDVEQEDITDISSGTMAGGIQVETDTGATMLFEQEDEDGETFVANWTYTIIPSSECLAEAAFCIPVLKFNDLPENKINPATVNQAEKDRILKAYQVFVEELNMFGLNLRPVVIDAWMERYSKFINAKWMVVILSGNGIEVTMLSVGLVIQDIENINYIEGSFTVDFDLYIGKITQGAPYDGLASAMNAAWTDLNGSHVAVGYEGDTAIQRILDNDFLFLDDPLKDGEVLIRDGRCNTPSATTLKPLTNDEYKEISGGITINDAKTPLTAVIDANGFVTYLQAKGMKIKFQPINGKFFPFQVNILDISVLSPRANLFPGLPVALYTFCILEQFTGLQSPLPSLPNQGEVRLIPTVKTISTPPWWNFDNKQMELIGTAYSDEEGDTGEKLRQAANFRIVYADTSVVNGWMLLLPFLFTAFTTQLQWLVTQPTTCAPTNMVSSILLIQNLVSGQKPYTGHENVGTNVIYLTYGVTGMFVTAVALMTFINITKDTGRIPLMVRYQVEIYMTLRSAGLLMTFLYVPVLAIKKNKETGRQEEIEWLWPVVGAWVCTFFSLRLIYVFYKGWQHAKAERVDETKEIEHIDLASRAVTTLSVEEVKHWISNCEELQEKSGLSKKDLEKIAVKFHDAKIDGRALVRTGCDTKTLIKFLGLTVGEAINFSDAFRKLMHCKSIRVDPEDEEQPAYPLFAEDEHDKEV